LKLKKDVKILKKVVISGIEKRVVSGKARNCKIVGGKVIEVYDEVSKQYLSIKEFQKLYNEKGERLGVEKKPEDQNLPSNINLSTSETLGIDIPQINVEIDNKKEEDIGIEKDIGIEEDIEEDADPFRWYVKKFLMRDI